MKFRLIPALLLTAWVARAQTPDPGAAQVPATPGAPTATTSLNEGTGSDTFLISAKYTNAVVRLPGAEDGKIAQTFARLLERTHYTRQRFDDKISARFFDRYLEIWDPQKLFLLQSDFDEFVPLRNKLDELTIQHSDTAPAYDIFNRFLQRFDQCYALVMAELQQGKFTFETDEQFVVNRKDEARPKDLEAAKKLWRDRIRYEYLAEKLGSFNPDDLRPKLLHALEAGKPEELATSLTNKLSPEKAGKLAELAKNKLAGEKLAQDKVVEALMAQLDTDRHDEIVKQLARRYNRTLRNLKQIEPDEVLQVWLDSLGHAYDPHTDYLGKRELDQFAISMNLSLFGIGATLQSEDGYTVIRSIVAGSPAEKSKQLKIGDKVVGVAQGDGDFVDVIDEKLNKVVDQIRGAKGTKVRLQTIPEGADSSVRKVVAIIRDEIKLEDSEAKSKLIEVPADNGQFTRVGVIDLPSFYANFPVGGRRGSGKTTTGDVAKLVKKLTAEGAQGIILDLRRNGGGSLEEAINLTGLFIKSGPVVQVRNFDGSVLVEEDSDESVAYDGPLMVLTSRFSASASEIVAGALQDYGRAIVVGDNSTHGKGTVQTVQELGNWLVRFAQNPGAAKITIRKFYRASGASTQLKGVAPDLVLPGVNNHLEVGEASLTNALPWDTIASAAFEKVNKIQPVLPELTRRSADRLAKDHDFNYVREDVERFKKRQAEKSVSMNEAKRRAEMAEDKARVEARKKELAERHEKQPTTYEITLKLADQDGLPAPVTNKVVVAVNKADARVLDVDKKEAAKKTDAEGEEDDAAEDEVAGDVTLKEAQRILLDLIRLNGRAPATARVP